MKLQRFSLQSNCGEAGCNVWIYAGGAFQAVYTGDHTDQKYPTVSAPNPTRHLLNLTWMQDPPVRGALQGFVRGQNGKLMLPHFSSTLFSFCPRNDIKRHRFLAGL